jgi:hypothetical protein
MLFQISLSPALGIDLAVDCYIVYGIFRKILHYQGKLTSECQLPEHLFHSFLNNLKTLVHKRIWRRHYQRIDQMQTNARELRIWKKLAVECFSVLRYISEPITWTSGRIIASQKCRPLRLHQPARLRGSGILFRPPGRFEVIFIIYWLCRIQIFVMRRL